MFVNGFTEFFAVLIPIEGKKTPDVRSYSQIKRNMRQFCRLRLIRAPVFFRKTKGAVFLTAPEIGF